MPQPAEFSTEIPVDMQDKIAESIKFVTGMEVHLTVEGPEDAK